MRFITHGDISRRKLMLIHGMVNTSSLFDPLLGALEDFYVIVCELDGHSEKDESEFISVEDSCEKIERYVIQELNGVLDGLLGFSLGGTIAVELLSRGKIRVGRTILDAAFTVKMGIKTYPFKWLFQTSILCIKKGIRIPKPLVESVMGKGNVGIMDTLYRGVSLRSISNACLSVYRYEIKDSIRNYSNPITFWHGSNEPYPIKSAELLFDYLPQLEVKVFPDMGHGQMLHEHPAEYARLVESFMNIT
ncbi:MAG: alpha/beta hydrolase [Clostridiales bacterium]|nr:alpha/beta hydrolase [Clostridiales bacterium]